MKVSFAPLQPDAVRYLTRATGIDFSWCRFDDPRWLCVTARDEDDEVMGVLACEFKNSFDVHFSTAILDQRCMSKRLLRTIFRTLFAKAVRVTALVSPANERAIKQMHRMGFVYEGFMRKGVEGHRDALMFGMLAEDCRFLPGYQPTHTSIPPLPLGGYHGLHS
jgi:hypothetical protein